VVSAFYLEATWQCSTWNTVARSTGLEPTGPGTLQCGSTRSLTNDQRSRPMRGEQQERFGSQYTGISLVAAYKRERQNRSYIRAWKP
jgi:hypothetical protein